MVHGHILLRFRRLGWPLCLSLNGALRFTQRRIWDMSIARLGLLVITVGSLQVIPANAEDFFLTIGGGYTRSANQASLERNALLFEQVLQAQHPEGLRHDIYFADGDGQSPDLQVIDRDTIPLANQLMAEFFGSERDLGLHYRNHQVPGVAGSTDPENIRKWFHSTGNEMQPGDRLVVYVTAHGNRSSDRDNRYETSIATWGRGAIKVSELVRLLDGLPDNVEVVVIMVQCYAGGFARYIFNDGEPEKGLSPQRRAGFFATVHDRPAAGCTAEVDDVDNREYSTVFWAALRGHDSAGQPIDPADYDQDGSVSFAEAHAYTILHAETVDLPVKSSGEFLRVYSRFRDDAVKSTSTRAKGIKQTANPGPLAADVDYALLLDLATPDQYTVLQGLSDQLGLHGDDRLADARRVLKDRSSRGRSRGRRNADPQRKLHDQIADDLKARWPELANPLNPLSIELLTARSDEFVAAIEQHPEYARYLELKSASRQTSSDDVKKVKHERFVRVCENIILAENLHRGGNEELIAKYESLLRAESATLRPPAYGVQ